ncbi:MAG: tetratricopeptide repeat protein [Chthoniobacterales bacterium]|nr:tetratricopeptide repeat protein [Chthoniobacterales bacterium]
MRRTSLLFLTGLVSLSLGQAVCGQESETLERAIAPLAEGVPQVAVERLQKFLTQNPSASERVVAQRKLAEALVRAGQLEKALEIFADPALTNDAESAFWSAQALAGLDRWATALPLYAQVAADPRSARRSEAAFGQAEALRALGRKKEAMRALQSLEKSPAWVTRAKLARAQLLLEGGALSAADRLLRTTKPQLATERSERRYLFGRLNLAQGHSEKAIETLNVILKNPEGVSHRLLVATLFALADAHAQQKTPEAGDDALEEFIDHHPNDSALPAIFARLDELYRLERKPSTNELERWLRDPAQPRQALAQWYLARSRLRAGDPDKAIALLTQLRDSSLRFPSLGAANLELARLHLARREWAEAIKAAEAARALNLAPAFLPQVDWLIAEANYRSGEMEKAARTYEELAGRVPALSGDALFNAALCWLRLDRASEFAADYRKISNDPGKQNLQGELLLEEGVVQAAQGKPEASETFRKFIRDFPQSPRLSEAWVALAELAFHAAPPDLAAARQGLAQARQANPTPAARERADYLEIWIEDATPSSNESAVVAAANKFLQQYPDSHRSAEVRMKLAEAYFRRQDFANAQTQFELLAQSAGRTDSSRGEQKPEAPLAEKALFFAARSATSSMAAGSLDHALALLDQVVKLDGDLKWAARNEEAAIERRLGKNREAQALYDEVLKNEARPAERREALCGKGDIFYEMGATDPENYRRAIEFYEKLAADPGAPPHWRNQAEFKKGKALEKLNDKSAALLTYYGVLEEGMRTDRQGEFFWFYKAGFNAAHLLEEMNDWKSAVAVFRKLAAVGGTRSDEAKARLTQLRLEHFLWEE